MAGNGDIEIFVGYFNRYGRTQSPEMERHSPVSTRDFDFGNSIISPVQCGAARPDVVLTPFCKYRDDTGDNISDRNRWYSDYTGRYWMWKNMSGKRKMVGWMMYRKVLDFSGSLGQFCSLSLTGNQNEVLEILSEEMISRQLDGIDLAINREFNNDPGLPMRRQFLKYHEPAVRMLDLLVERMRQIDHPFARFFVEECSPDQAYFPIRFLGLVVMRSDLYDEMCSLLFPILFSIEDRAFLDGLDDYNRMAMGMVAERLFGCYYIWMANEKNLKTRELGTLFLRD